MILTLRKSFYILGFLHPRLYSPKGWVSETIQSKTSGRARLDRREFGVVLLFALEHRINGKLRKKRDDYCDDIFAGHVHRLPFYYRPMT